MTPLPGRPSALFGFRELVARNQRRKRHQKDVVEKTENFENLNFASVLVKE